MLFFPFQMRQQQTHTTVVVLQKLLDSPIWTLQRVVISRKPHNGIKKSLVADCHARQDRPEEVVGVVGHAVVVVGNVFVKVVEVKLYLVRKKGPVCARS